MEKITKRYIKEQQEPRKNQGKIVKISNSKIHTTKNVGKSLTKKTEEDKKNSRNNGEEGIKKEKNFRSVTKTTGTQKAKQGEEHSAIKKIDYSLFIEAMAGPKGKKKEGQEPEKELKKEASLKWSFRLKAGKTTQSKEAKGSGTGKSKKQDQWTNIGPIAPLGPQPTITPIAPAIERGIRGYLSNITPGRGSINVEVEPKKTTKMPIKGGVVKIPIKYNELLKIRKKPSGLIEGAQAKAEIYQYIKNFCNTIISWNCAGTHNIWSKNKKGEEPKEKTRRAEGNKDNVEEKNKNGAEKTSEGKSQGEEPKAIITNIPYDQQKFEIVKITKATGTNQGEQKNEEGEATKQNKVNQTKGSSATREEGTEKESIELEQKRAKYQSAKGKGQEETNQKTSPSRKGQSSSARNKKEKIGTNQRTEAKDPIKELEELYKKEERNETSKQGEDPKAKYQQYKQTGNTEQSQRLIAMCLGIFEELENQAAYQEAKKAKYQSRNGQETKGGEANKVGVCETAKETANMAYNIMRRPNILESFVGTVEKKKQKRKDIGAEGNGMQAASQTIGKGEIQREVTNRIRQLINASEICSVKILSTPSTKTLWSLYPTLFLGKSEAKGEKKETPYIQDVILSINIPTKATTNAQGEVKKGEAMKIQAEARSKLDKQKRIGVSLTTLVAALSRTICKKPAEYILATGTEKALSFSTSILYMKHYWMYTYNQNFAKEREERGVGTDQESQKNTTGRAHTTQKAEQAKQAKLLSSSWSVSKIKARYYAISKIRRNAIKRLMGGRTKNPINLLLKRYPAERRFLEAQGEAKNNIKPYFGAEKSRMVSIDTMLYNAIRSTKLIGPKEKK